MLLLNEDGTMSRAQAVATFQALYLRYAECARRHAGLVQAWPR